MFWTPLETFRPGLDCCQPLTEAVVINERSKGCFMLCDTPAKVVTAQEPGCITCEDSAELCGGMQEVSDSVTMRLVLPLPIVPLSQITPVTWAKGRKAIARFEVVSLSALCPQITY